MWRCERGGEGDDDGKDNDAKERLGAHGVFEVENVTGECWREQSTFRIESRWCRSNCSTQGIPAAANQALADVSKPNNLLEPADGQGAFMEDVATASAGAARGGVNGGCIRPGPMLIDRACREFPGTNARASSSFGY